MTLPLVVALCARAAKFPSAPNARARHSQVTRIKIMQPEFWSDKRPAGVPHEIDLGAYKSVIEVFERSCKKYADRPAFSNMGVTLTYAELDRLSAAFAGYLQKHTDLKPGERIAVQLPNVLHYP